MIENSLYNFAEEKEAFWVRIKYSFEELGLRRLENGYFKENEK